MAIHIEITCPGVDMHGPADSPSPTTAGAVGGRPITEKGPSRPLPRRSPEPPCGGGGGGSSSASGGGGGGGGGSTRLLEGNRYYGTFVRCEALRSSYIYTRCEGVNFLRYLPMLRFPGALPIDEGIGALMPNNATVGGMVGQQC